MKNKFLKITGAILISAFFVGMAFGSGESDNKSENSNKQPEKISCMVCGKDLTNDHNRIAPNGNGYYCTPCYKQTMRQVHDDIRAQGYD